MWWKTQGLGTVGLRLKILVLFVLAAAPAAGARTSSTAGAEAEEEPVKNDMTRMNRPPKAQ